MKDSDMDFALTAEQKQIKEMVSEFVDEEVKPRAAEIDETDEFPGTSWTRWPTSA